MQAKKKGYTTHIISLYSIIGVLYFIEITCFLFYALVGLVFSGGSTDSFKEGFMLYGGGLLKGGFFTLLGIAAGTSMRNKNREKMDENVHLEIVFIVLIGLVIPYFLGAFQIAEALFKGIVFN